MNGRSVTESSDLHCKIQLDVNSRRLCRRDADTAVSQPHSPLLLTYAVILDFAYELRRGSSCFYIAAALC